MNKPEWCDSKSDLFIYWLKVLGLLSHIRDITMDTSSHVALEAGWLNLTVKLLNFRKPVEWEDCYGLPSHSSLLAYYAGDSLQACWTRGSFCWYIDRVTLRLLEQLEDHFCWSLTGPPSSGADHEIDSWSNGLPSFAGHHQIPWGWEFGVCILDSTLGVRYNLKIHECVAFGDFPAKVICESQPLDWTKETCKLFVHVMLSALIFSHQNLLHENLWSAW